MIREHNEVAGPEVEKAGCVYEFEMSPLGNRLMEIRKEFISEGGTPWTSEEL
ncbi:MAG: hypothetical protein WBG50_19240 [Desulfomonilaceae bacterium]